MGASGEDIMLSPEARKLFPVSVECKSRNRIAIYKDYEQAKTNNPNNDDYFTLLFLKQNNSRPLVVLDAEDFIKHIMSRLTW